MYKTLQSVKAAPVTKELPKELQIVVNDLTNPDMPSHVLGVYANHTAPGTSRQVTLYPTHNIVLSAHCANLPPIPAPSQPTPTVAPATLTVPVLPLCIPSPQTFPALQTYLYTKRIDALLAFLLPTMPPTLPADAGHAQTSALQREFPAQLARTHSVAKLLSHAMRVNGLWRNACALGVHDDGLWTAITLGWEVLLDALAVSTNTARL
jgi:hypothetical protein